MRKRGRMQPRRKVTEMQSAKIEQLRKDIAALEVVIAILEPGHEITVSLQDILFCKKKAAESLENAAIPAEIVRVFQLKLGDLIFNSAKFERISEILVERRPGGMTHIKAGSNSYTLRHDSLVVRKLEAEPCD